MVTLRRATSLVALVLGILSLAAPAAGAGDHIARMQLDGVIDQITSTYIQEGLKSAADGNAAAVILEIDSPGGDLASMDNMLEAILASPIPVITYVAPQGGGAGSAATFITLAGDVAAMAPSTSIGAAAVVGAGGTELSATETEKVTNFYAAKIHQLAAEHDRNTAWAESAVRKAASLGAADAVAMKPPVVDILASSETQLLAAIDTGKRADGYAYQHDGKPLPKLSGLPITDINMNPGQSLLQLLADPNLAFILFTIGFYGILAELFHPNYLTGSLGAIALVLAFLGSGSLPLNLGGLILIIIGIGLFVLDLHLPSHGLLTLGGLVCFVLGASALWTGVEPGEAINVSVSPFLLVAVVALSLYYFTVLLRGLVQTRRRMPHAPLPITRLIGEGGMAQTLLAPHGIAYAGGETWSARSNDAEIRPGTPIKVVGRDGLELIVEPATNAGDAPIEGRKDPSNA